MKKLLDGMNVEVGPSFEEVKARVLSQGCVGTDEDRGIQIAKEDVPEASGGFIVSINDDKTFSSAEFSAGDIDKAVRKFLKKVA